MNFITQAKSNRLDLWFDTLDPADQKNLIKKGRQCQQEVKERCKAELKKYNEDKLRKKERDSQSQRTRDIQRSQRRR